MSNPLTLTLCVSVEGHLPEMQGPDPCTVTSFASRQLLELLAAVLHVPSLHAAHVASTPALAAQIKGPQVEAALMQPLLAGGILLPLMHCFVCSCWPPCLWSSVVMLMPVHLLVMQHH